MNVSEYKKLWAIIAGVIILNAGFALGVTVPLLQSIVKSRAVISDAERRIAMLDAERTHFLKLERRILQEKDVFRRIEKTALSLSEPLPFIELIEGLAEEQTVKARMLVRDAPTSGFQNFQLIAEGDFPHVLRYLQILEFMPYQLTFSRLQAEFFEPKSSESAIKKRVAVRDLKRARARLTLDFAVRIQ